MISCNGIGFIEKVLEKKPTNEGVTLRFIMGFKTSTFVEKNILSIEVELSSTRGSKINYFEKIFLDKKPFFFYGELKQKKTGELYISMLDYDFAYFRANKQNKTKQIDDGVDCSI